MCSSEVSSRRVIMITNLKVGQVWELRQGGNNWHPLPLPPNFTMRLQYAHIAFEITEVLDNILAVKARCVKDRTGTFGYGM